MFTAQLNTVTVFVVIGCDLACDYSSLFLGLAAVARVSMKTETRSIYCSPVADSEKYIATSDMRIILKHNCK